MNKLPFLLVDRQKCSSNIDRLLLKCEGTNVKIRPHFKTHQSVEVGTLFRERGIDRITVSSLQMAEYFADANWSNILIAFPFYPQMADGINSLAKKVKIGILFSSLKNLLKSVDLIHSEVDVYIEVDVGYGRSGISATNTREIALMLNFIKNNSKLIFKGFLTHAGQTYSATSTAEIIEINKKSMCQLSKLKQFWKDSYPNIQISYGDTPSASVADNFWAIDELRAGNFVYYDVMQYRLSACSASDIAVALIAPVVDVYADRGEMLLHAGAVHLSKEFIKNDDGSICYGLVCKFNSDTQKWSEPLDDVYVKSLSQEHGIVAFKANTENPFSVGDLVAILPVHSCLAANLMRGSTFFV